MGIPSKQGREPTLKLKILSAGLAGCIGDVATFPLDVAKVRLQIQGEGSATAQAAKEVAKQLKYRGIIGTLVTISREEGARAMYSGLAPGLQRQMAFSSIRIGLYDTVKKSYFNFFKVNEKNGGQNIPLRIAAGITTGGMAVVCAQPTDVVKVRLQASAGVRRYRSSIHAYKTIAAEEGVRGLWKGTLPNIARNSVVNASELVSYDLFKSNILAMQLMSDSMPCHFLSAFGAGLVTTILASPIDVVKTRFMNSEPGVYRGALHCAMTMFKDNGPLAFYKGVVPSFTRLVSWNIVMFVAFEQLKRGFLKAEDAYYDGSILSPKSWLTPAPLSNVMKHPFEAQLQSQSKYVDILLTNTLQYYTDME